MPNKPKRTKLTLEEDKEFFKVYNAWALMHGMNVDPDDPGHKYDYRGAFKAGFGPDHSGHWPSRWKDEDHPNRFINGRDTKKE